MSTKATVTLSIQSFTSWDGSQAAGPEQCCKATASIDSNDESKIKLGTTTDPTDFVIEIFKHGDHTSLTFEVTPGDTVAGSYKSFLPIGIALRESDTNPVDPTGTAEFPSVEISDDKSGNRALTLDVAGNETATWNFFLVIQGVPADGATTGYDIGIVDPRIKGSAN